MATSLFFIPTYQNTVRNPNELVGNTHLVNDSAEIRTEPQKNRGRKPGSKKNQQNQKKQKRRGVSIAQLERQIAEEEKKKMVDLAGDKSEPNHNPNASSLPVPDPDIVLQGYPSYGGCPTTSLGGCRSRIYCGGGALSGQIMIDPVCSPWSSVETSTHELSSIPNPQVYSASNTHCDTCFKKKRLDRDENVVRSNSGGFSNYSFISPINGYRHLLQSDQRSHVGFLNDQIIARSMDKYWSNVEGNPKNGLGEVKEYEFFPIRKYDKFTGIHGKTVSVATTVVGDCGPNTSTIDLSLKL